MDDRLLNASDRGKEGDVQNWLMAGARANASNMVK